MSHCTPRSSKVCACRNGDDPHPPNVRHGLSSSQRESLSLSPLFPSHTSLQQAVRYSALVGGIGYGIVHRRTLQKREDARAIVAEKKHQEHLKLQAQKEADAKILATVRGGGGSGE